jgi:Phytanoyl-CoA dioxygenase (PhyH)
MDWQDQVRISGYAQFPDITPPELIAAARDAIDRDLRDNYEPVREVEYSNQSYCPDLKGTPPIKNLLEKSPVLNVVDEAVGLDKVAWDGGQIAIRRAHNCDREVPPEPHIDGFASDRNGLEFGRVYNHAVTVGVFLTPLPRAFAGNFAVWPGSHHVYEEYFRERGPVAMKEPMPTPEIGEPVQLMCEVGDAVLSHYQLAHAAAVNTADIDRIAVYFRIWFRDAESNEQRWECLTNIWHGWKIKSS